MPISITLPGGTTGGFGPTSGVDSASFYTNQTNVAFPTIAQGVRANVNGTYIVRVHSINPDRLTGSPQLRLTVAGQNYAPGETVSFTSQPSSAELRLFYNGIQPTWYRNNDGLGRCTDRNINTGVTSFTYGGSIAGTWSWATVPAQTDSISVSVSGTTATITRGTSVSDASYPVTSYVLERRESTNGITFGAWTSVSTNMGTSYNNTGLTAAKYYQFRVYAVNGIGSSQAVVSSTVFIAAITRYDQSTSNFILLSKLKKHNGTTWTNITSVKRWNGTGWEIIDISSIPNL